MCKQYACTQQVLANKQTNKKQTKAYISWRLGKISNVPALTLVRLVDEIRLREDNKKVEGVRVMSEWPETSEQHCYRPAAYVPSSRHNSHSCGYRAGPAITRVHACEAGAIKGDNAVGVVAYESEFR